MLAVDYLLNEYKPTGALERADLERFRQFVAEYGKKIYDRTPGQPTILASAFVVNPDFTKALLIHHRAHGQIKQFGGHADGKRNLAAVSARELKQESGARGTLLYPLPIDIIRWNVPFRNKDGIDYPEHDGFDILFLFMMSESTKLKPNKREAEGVLTEWMGLKIWRDKPLDPKNPTDIANPQNWDY